MRYLASVLLLIPMVFMSLGCSKKQQDPEAVLPGTWYPVSEGKAACDKPPFDSTTMNISYDAKTGWFIGGYEWSCDGVATCGGEGNEWMVKYTAELESDGETLIVKSHDYPVKDKKKLLVNSEKMRKCPESS